ncbi:hypothetical protein EUGRSUZ_G01444 [Eucalyptus grandis]|uniref:Uncharacterized protein n=2 Tax=Eucalyptus grandis TaxID=71139 RepID=A0ACC3K3T6_EUCGR|nr:hypothetical protein EUGRSUZ_G01444 [Eucalyptus grandis]
MVTSEADRRHPLLYLVVAEHFPKLAPPGIPLFRLCRRALRLWILLALVRSDLPPLQQGRRAALPQAVIDDGEVELRSGAPELDGRVVVCAGRLLCSVEGPEPDPSPAPWVADLRRPFPPWPLPHAPIAILPRSVLLTCVSCYRCMARPARRVRRGLPVRGTRLRLRGGGATALKRRWEIAAPEAALDPALATRD